MRVSVIGVGKTGLPIAVALQSKGHVVLGAEISLYRIGQLENPFWKSEEPGCSWEERKGIFYTPSVADAVTSTELSVLIVNTPELSPGKMDLAPIKGAAGLIAKGLAEKSHHTLVVSSTVLPGTCREVISPIVGPRCSVIFNPIWIALGSVVEDYLHPPVAVLGSDIPLSQEVISFFCGTSGLFGDAPLLCTDTCTAESIKIFYNVWCTLKMAFVNETARMFQEQGADPLLVEKFFRLGGERVGKFLKPGPPFGGPCFPRDLRFAKEVAPDMGLVDQIAEVNKKGYTRIESEIRGKSKIGIAGLTYKAGVAVLEESSSLTLASKLSRAGYIVGGWDPLIKEDLSGVMSVHRSLEELAEDSEVIVEMHEGLVPKEVEQEIQVVRPWL